MRTIAIAALVVTLAGCADYFHDADLAACDQKPAEVRAQCILDADAADQHRRAVALALSGGVQNYSAAQAAQPVYVPPPQPVAWQPTTVTCNTWNTGATRGATEQTTCTAR